MICLREQLNLDISINYHKEYSKKCKTFSRNKLELFYSKAAATAALTSSLSDVVTLDDSVVTVNCAPIRRCLFFCFFDVNCGSHVKSEFRFFERFSKKKVRKLWFDSLVNKIEIIVWMCHSLQFQLCTILNLFWMESVTDFYETFDKEIISLGQNIFLFWYLLAFVAVKIVILFG